MEKLLSKFQDSSFNSLGCAMIGQSVSQSVRTSVFICLDVDISDLNELDARLANSDTGKHSVTTRGCIYVEKLDMYLA